MAAEGYSSSENQDGKRNLKLNFPEMGMNTKSMSLASMGHPTQMTYVRESRTRMQVKAALWGDLRWRSAERATPARRADTPERNSMQRRSQTPERLMSSRFRTHTADQAAERPTLSLVNTQDLPDTRSYPTERQSRPVVRQSPTQIQGRLLSDLKLQQKRVEPPDRPALWDSKPQQSVEMREHFQLDLNSGASSAPRQQVEDLEPVWQLRSEQSDHASVTKQDSIKKEAESHQMSPTDGEIYETSLDSFSNSVDGKNLKSHLNLAAMQTGMIGQAQERPYSDGRPHASDSSGKGSECRTHLQAGQSDKKDLIGNGKVKLYLRNNSDHLKYNSSHLQTGIPRFVADLQQEDRYLRPRSNSAVGYTSYKSFPAMGACDRSYTADNILKLKQRNPPSGSVLSSPDSDYAAPVSSTTLTRVHSGPNLRISTSTLDTYDSAAGSTSHEQQAPSVSAGSGSIDIKGAFTKPVAPHRTSLSAHSKPHDVSRNMESETGSFSTQRPFIRGSQNPEQFQSLDAGSRRGSAPPYPALLARSQSPGPGETLQQTAVLPRHMRAKTSEIEELTANIHAMKPVPPARPSLMFRSQTPDLISNMQHLEVNMRRNSVPERPSALSMSIKSSSLRNLDHGISSPPAQRKFSVPRFDADHTGSVPLELGKGICMKQTAVTVRQSSVEAGDKDTSTVSVQSAHRIVQGKISVTDHPLLTEDERKDTGLSHPLSDETEHEASSREASAEKDQVKVAAGDGDKLEQTDKKPDISGPESSSQTAASTAQQAKESSGIGAAIKRSNFFNCFHKYNAAQTPEYGCAPDETLEHKVPKSDKNVPLDGEAGTCGSDTQASSAHAQPSQSGLTDVKMTPRSQRRQPEQDRASSETAEPSQPLTCQNPDSVDRKLEDAVWQHHKKTAEPSKKPESPRRQSRTCTPDRRSLFRACVGRSDTTSPVESQYDLIATGRNLQPPRQVLQKQPVAQESMQLVVKPSVSGSRPSQTHQSKASHAGHGEGSDNTTVCSLSQPPREWRQLTEEVQPGQAEQKGTQRHVNHVKMSPTRTDVKLTFNAKSAQLHKPMDLFAPVAPRSTSHVPSSALQYQDQERYRLESQHTRPPATLTDLPRQPAAQTSSKFEFNLPISNVAPSTQSAASRPESQRAPTNLLTADTRPSPSEMKEYFQMDLNQPKSSEEGTLENMPFQFTPRSQRSRTPETLPFKMAPQANRPDLAECGSSQMSMCPGRDPIPGSSRWRERLRSQSLENTGKLQISPDRTFDFTAEDLVDQGEIGRGAYGTVNKMYHEQSGTLMAVKRIRSTVDEKEQKQLLMDLDVVMRSNDCPYIVQFYGALFKEGDCWICMEVMSISLDKFYKYVYHVCNDRIPEDIIGRVTVATLKALSYLKDKLKIIHRDVKPSNILLDTSGNIKLCDFGISGQLIDSIAKTRDAGCRPYMAPERIDPRASSRGYDVRSDVWSLGITLIELATGKFPYPKWNSVFDQLTQVVQGDPPNLRDNDERFSQEFIHFVNTCLTKDQESRPKYAKLLRLPFIRKYEETEVDVAAYVISILNLMPEDRSELDTLLQNSS